MLRATGIVRKIDHMGRIVLPSSLRKSLSIKSDDEIELFVDNDGSIILEKYKPKCIFCGEDKNITNIMGKDICSDCQKELKLMN